MPPIVSRSDLGIASETTSIILARLPLLSLIEGLAVGGGTFEEIEAALGRLRGKASSKGFKQSRRTLKADLPRKERPDDSALLVDEFKPGAAVGTDV
jgi:hypothetical protein